MVDQNGHAVGVITDLYVDDATGRPEWAGVKSGLFSHREMFVPLAQATPHGMRVQVPYDHGHIHDAPTIDPDGHLSVEEEARLYEHYGLEYRVGPYRTAPSSPAGTSTWECSGPAVAGCDRLWRWTATGGLRLTSLWLHRGS